MKKVKGKSRRTRIFSIITVALIAVLIGLNLLLSVVGQKSSVYIDLTPEGLYSVTDKMVDECKFIDDLDGQKVKIIFCNDPDNLASSAVTRVTYFMALNLAREFDNLEVETVNVNFNPTAVAKYKTTSLSKINPSDVIVAYGDRYRILGAPNFWTVSDGAYYSYNGEYKMATALKSVTLANDKNPTAYFVTGHGETCYDDKNPDSESSSATVELKHLLTERGLKTALLDISSVDAIPNDCALLIINNPTSDFATDPDRYNEFSYVSDIEKVERYLTKNQGALMIAKDPSVNLPILDELLYEWGFDFSDSFIKDKESSLGENVINGVYNTDEESFGYAIYGDFASLESAPKTIFKNTGYVSCSFGESSTINEPGAANVSKRYASFLTTPASARPYAFDSLTGGYDAPSGDAGVYDLAAVTTRSSFDSKTAEYTYSYVFCANSKDFFSNEILSNASCANYDVISALINNVSRSDIYASSELGGISLNLQNIGGKKLVSTVLTTEDVSIFSEDGKEIVKTNYAVTGTVKTVVTVAVAVIPLAMLVLGIVVSVKRKYK